MIKIIGKILILIRYCTRKYVLPYFYSQIIYYFSTARAGVHMYELEFHQN